MLGIAEKHTGTHGGDAMFIRRDKKHRKGRDVTYLSIAHNVWEHDADF